MRNVNLTLDDYSDKMLKLLALSYGISRSEVVRKLIKARAEKDNGILRGYCDLIERELQP
ncbi:hypothetical protein [Cohnella sp. AR92]|uniref:hypothetical protein n=1 Tax=Cohnella sp. AR92 TaxID=648716 RepID=UPI000F8EC8C3|nr:hypothetical protein [Cohnella sp. AR92]RUS47608.1 hypothetical protein ELR57_07415 [Cohnella sp. AR92]